MRSTKLFMPSASAALVSSHSLRVSSLMKRSSNSFLSCGAAGRVKVVRRRQHRAHPVTPRACLVRAPRGAVEAAVLHDQVQHLWPDLRACGGRAACKSVVDARACCAQRIRARLLGQQQRRVVRSDTVQHNQVAHDGRQECNLRAVGARCDGERIARADK